MSAPVATQVQLRRGTAAQMATFIGAQNELCATTDTHQLVLHDGVTLGGFTTGTSVFAYELNGNPPDITPAVNAAILTDISTGREWKWWGNAWH